MSIIAAVLVFGLIVLFHEFGHYLMARKSGVCVLEFSLGMGPRIVSFVRGGTRYSLKALPIGGSCMMLGEDEADVPEDMGFGATDEDTPERRGGPRNGDRRSGY